MHVEQMMKELIEEAENWDQEPKPVGLLVKHLRERMQACIFKSKDVLWREQKNGRAKYVAIPAQELHIVAVSDHVLHRFPLKSPGPRVCNPAFLFV